MHSVRLANILRSDNPTNSYANIVLPSDPNEKLHVLLPPLPDVNQSSQYLESYSKKALDRKAFEPLCSKNVSIVNRSSPVLNNLLSPRSPVSTFFGFTSMTTTLGVPGYGNSTQAQKETIFPTASTITDRHNPIMGINLRKTPSTAPCLSLEDLEHSQQFPLEKRRKHRCRVCKRSFTTSGHLTRHNRIHTGEKNHLCRYPGCGQRFSRHDNCLQHYRIHLKKNGK